MIEHKQRNNIEKLRNKAFEQKADKIRYSMVKETFAKLWRLKPFVYSDRYGKYNVVYSGRYGKYNVKKAKFSGEYYRIYTSVPRFTDYHPTTFTLRDESRTTLTPRLYAMRFVPYGMHFTAKKNMW